MSQPAPLNEEEIDAQFHISERRSILFSLSGHAHRRDRFTVHFDERKQSFLTSLLSVDPYADELIVDASGSREINARFLRSERSIFEARPEGVSTRFVTGMPREVEYEGWRAFALPLPKLMVRLQRRENFRVTIPLSKRLDAEIRLSNEDRCISLSVHDLSVTGCGLNSSIVPSRLNNGLSLADCRFELPDTKHTTIATGAVVRHVTALSSPRGSAQFRIGLQFEGLKRNMEHAIQRYLVQVQRDRREVGSR